MTEDRESPGSRAERLAPFNLRVESGQLAVRDALRDFLDALSPLKLDLEERGTVEIVLAEVLNNIVEHAYPATDGGGPILITCAPQPDGLVVEITDQGTSMPNGCLPLCGMSHLDIGTDIGDLPEGGFGWFLIRNLAKDVTYDRIGNENHLKMRLAIGLAS